MPSAVQGLCILEGFGALEYGFARLQDLLVRRGHLAAELLPGQLPMGQLRYLGRVGDHNSRLGRRMPKEFHEELLAEDLT